MKTVKTARGRTLDMGTLAAKNETTRAVSNLNMNARGDIIDNRGNVEIPREKIQKEFYKDNVPGADTEEISIKQEETRKEKKGLILSTHRSLKALSVSYTHLTLPTILRV